MTAISLFKILSEEVNEFKRYLLTEYDEIANEDNTIASSDGTNVSFSCTLYYSESEKSALKWNWVFKLFEESQKEVTGHPKGILTISFCGNIYAITFGHSFFSVDKYSDKNWPFEFARRCKYTNIRTTALTNPNSQRSKTVNTYLDYNDMDFDGGEALSKLKAKIELNDDFDLFKESIEIGNSIKLNCEIDSLSKIAKIINHIEELIKTKNPTIKIPYFHKIKDKDTIEKLDGILKKAANDDYGAIDFSEYQIYGTHIIFKGEEEYKLKLGWKEMTVDALSMEQLNKFIRVNDIDLNQNMDNLKVWVYRDGKSIYNTSIKKLMFFTAESEKSIFTDGNWYQYNIDYLSYLADSIREICVEHKSALDYDSNDHETFIEEKVKEEMATGDNPEETEDKCRKRIKRKYYKEYYFNVNLEKKHGYTNFDRDLDAVGKHKFEVMDLYKENTMYSVKFGNSSSKLCYAIDQSFVAAKEVRAGNVDIGKEINNVCIWLVLERKPLPLRNDGQPDLNELKMLILKNKLDEWKKNIRLMGYTPQIRINYKQ